MSIVLTLAADRLDQVYRRIPDKAARQRYDCAAPAFDFTSRFVYDESGLVVEYPGIAVRVRESATARLSRRPAAG